jgi:hypothetical protein
MLCVVFVVSGFTENPPIWSWEVNACFLRGGSVIVVIGCRFCPHWYLSMEYRIVKWVLTWQWFPLARSWCYLGMFPRHSDVRRCWDGFSTQVLDARGTWAPTATSRRGPCLRLTLPEAHNEWYLSVSGSPQACGRPGPLLGLLGKVDRWWNLVLLHLIVGWWSDDMVRHFD